MKPLKLKPLNEQVIFITGATSEIGLATVHLAVEQGASVFLVAKNLPELIKLHEELTLKGYRCDYKHVDVASLDQLQLAAEQCLNAFDHIDTFIYNSGVSIESKILETSEEEARRVFDTNFWGIFNLCKVAVPLLSEEGGVIINVGSALSNTNIGLPIQGLFSASKYAVKGFMDSLRRELKSEKLPIQVKLILPPEINTPSAGHTYSHRRGSSFRSSAISSVVFARGILKCATSPDRELGLGVPAFIFSITERLFPSLQERVLANFFMEEEDEEGDLEGHIKSSSLMTELSVKKSLAKGSAIAAGLFYLVSERVIPWLINERKSTDHRS